MIDFDSMTPAGGVVEFHIWPLDGDILIEGSPMWRRPVTGMIGDEPVVVAESGELMLAVDYLDTVIPRALQPDHTNLGKYWNYSVPVGNAPTVTVR